VMRKRTSSPRTTCLRCPPIGPVSCGDGGGRSGGDGGGRSGGGGGGGDPSFEGFTSADVPPPVARSGEAQEASRARPEKCIPMRSPRSASRGDHPISKD